MVLRTAILAIIPALTCGCDFFLLRTEGELHGDGDAVRDDGAIDVRPDSDGAAEDGSADDAVEPGCATHAECDDGVGCTYDTCAEGTRRCSHAANPAWCPAGYRCDPHAGCVTDAACANDADCNDGIECTVDVCLPGEALCRHDPPDADADGVGDMACGGGDCDDGQPSVRPLYPELCLDRLDNDCDGLTDYQDGACPPPYDNDRCDRALVLLPGDVTIAGDSTSLTDTAASALCGGADGADAFYSFTIAAAAQVTIDTIGSDYDTVLWIRNGCAGPEIACNDDRADDPRDGSRIVLRALSPGTFVVAVDGRTASDRGRHVLNLRLGPPQTAATDCNRVIDVTKGGTVIGYLGARDLLDFDDGGSCGGGGGFGGQQERFLVNLTPGALLRVSSAGTSFPSYLYARSNGCWNLLEEIACGSGPAGAGAVIDIAGRGGPIHFTLDADRYDRSGTYRLEINP